MCWYICTFEQTYNNKVFSAFAFIILEKITLKTNFSFFILLLQPLTLTRAHLLQYFLSICLRYKFFSLPLLARICLYVLWHKYKENCGISFLYFLRFFLHTSFATLPSPSLSREVKKNTKHIESKEWQFAFS